MPLLQFIFISAVTGKPETLTLDTDNVGGGGAMANVDGGAADTIYLPDQCYDGGDASGS